MIEQFYTFFTFEIVYLWMNIGVIPLWFVLIFFPQSKICKIFVTSLFPLLIFSIFYCYLLFIIFLQGYDFLENFQLYLGFDYLSYLAKNESFLILLWLHFLAINLFCGSWIVKSSQKFAISKYLVFLPLLITYFIGPLGLLIYWFIKIFFSKKISLYD